MSVAVCSDVSVELKGRQAAYPARTHMSLYSNFQNCHRIHCGTLKVDTAPVPGDSNAVGVKIRS